MLPTVWRVFVTARWTGEVRHRSERSSSPRSTARTSIPVASPVAARSFGESGRAGLVGATSVAGPWRAVPVPVPARAAPGRPDTSRPAGVATSRPYSARRRVRLSRQPRVAVEARHDELDRWSRAGGGHVAGSAAADRVLAGLDDQQAAAVLAPPGPVRIMARGRAEIRDADPSDRLPAPYRPPFRPPFCSRSRTRTRPQARCATGSAASGWATSRREPSTRPPCASCALLACDRPPCHGPVLLDAEAGAPPPVPARCARCDVARPGRDLDAALVTAPGHRAHLGRRAGT